MNDINNSQSLSANLAAQVFRKTGYALKSFSSSGESIRTLFFNGRHGELAADCASFAGLNERWQKDHPERDVTAFVIYDTYDGTISREVLNRVINACISYQWSFIKSGDVHDCRMMGLKDIEKATGIDVTTISRATRDVCIFTRNGSYTLDCTVMDIEHPSLFDDGATRNGKSVSRLEVITEIRNIICSESPADPYTDQEIAGILNAKGYDIARRTVAKYREEFLDIPKRCIRRQAA